ncbi:ADP-glyceromanno-heptose 6-epimerase [Pararhodospirillum oryzae]|uniref:ADP-L-glycero-D-manno-heptose-6-epimerase n=1 Tax=Pararhodospirillum oryzae TaxID=478448 RepID=A0A512H4C2_9PROT|nr:ADP-glyceromanno-heptose 6-epimerase [Pararhodospirillum oryzae]GEO80315.1 ADP-L-glycero-D-manno-heptose-6-epimerase [Pararhodospirillum oryzae]
MILVTGGAGFIGSNILAGLEARGFDDLVVVDRLRDGDKWRNIAKRALADIITPADLPAFLAAHQGEIAVIIHMGAISATTETDVDRIVANNVRLTLDLWSWCTRHGARFIYASSAATYGAGDEGFDDAFTPEALARLRPLNPYGWSKHMIDRRLCALVRSGAATPPQWAGLKFFNVYGPNEAHKGPMRSVVHQIHPFAREGKPFGLFKSYREGIPDGGQLRDFIWVDDVVDVVSWLVDTPTVSGLFNVGTGQARSFADLASAVYRALDQAPRLEYRDMPESLRPRYQYFTEARMDRLRQAGYPGSFTPLEEGVRRYVQDYLEKSDPFR